jgi:hypothetical protein
MAELDTCHSRSDRRRHREADAEAPVIGSCRRVLRHRVEHLPGEALGVERGVVGGLGLQLDGHRAAAEPEARHEVDARVGLGDHERARLADGDAEVLDVVDREVEPGGEPGGRGADDRRVGPLGREPELDVGARCPRVVCHLRQCPVLEADAPHTLTGSVS